MEVGRGKYFPDLVIREPKTIIILGFQVSTIGLVFRSIGVGRSDIIQLRYSL